MFQCVGVLWGFEEFRNVKFESHSFVGGFGFVARCMFDIQPEGFDNSEFSYMFSSSCRPLMNFYIH